MAVDVNQTVEFRASAARLFSLAALTLACAAVSLAAGWPVLPNVAPGSFVQFAGWAGTLLFFTAFLLKGSRCLKSNIPIIKLSPAGLWDSRVSSAFIPWPEVEKVSVWNYRNNKVVVLKISDAAWRKLPLARMARWTRVANQSVGADGLCIATTEFGVKFDDFSQAVDIYFQAFSGKAG